MTLNTPQLKLLASAIFHYFRKQDNPPAQDMFIPINDIKAVKGEDGLFTASIRYVVEYCGRKENKVRIKFNVDPTGRFQEKTWVYA